MSGGRRYRGISSPPSPQSVLLPVEELENKHGFGPWLMFADAENNKRGGEGFRRCYSFSSREIFSLPAPQLQGRRCWGTQYGWLITFGPCGDVHLFNPLTHQQLPLPSRRTIRTSNKVSDDRLAFFKSFSLSSNPSDSDHRPVIMSTYGGCCQLAFSSPGDKAWKYLSDSVSSHTANSDTIFYRGQFYSIDCQGKLKVCDITSGKPRERHITTFADRSTDKFYLVEMSRHLHLICRIYGYYEVEREGELEDEVETESFDIYRFDFQETKWISIEDLNGHALFVGNNTTFAISATDYPKIKPNCVYFTDDVTIRTTQNVEGKDIFIVLMCIVFILQYGII